VAKHAVLVHDSASPLPAKCIIKAYNKHKIYLTRSATAGVFDRG